ncbi:hypothetical protein Tco_0540927 [Tanacetum coccineum]
MACSLPHTNSEIEALVQRLINEDKGHQDAVLELAFRFEDSCAKELHQLRMDEEALKEMLEEEAMNKKAQEEKIRQEQAENNAFFLEFGVVRYDLEYESSD